MPDDNRCAGGLYLINKTGTERLDHCFGQLFSDNSTNVVSLDDG